MTASAGVRDYRKTPLRVGGMNRERVDLVRVVLAVFAYGAGYPGALELEPATVLGDLLVDLRHWADAEGIDVDELFADVTALHYEEERRTENGDER